MTVRSMADGSFNGGVLQQDEAVSHAGDVVSDDAGQAFEGNLVKMAEGKLCGLIDPEVEEFGHDLFGFIVLA